MDGLGEREWLSRVGLGVGKGKAWWRRLFANSKSVANYS